MINWILIGLVVFLILLVIFAKFYQKSSKDIAFVRTGMFGQKIVLTGGALAIPIVHQTTPVNMNTLKLEIERKESNGIITKDKMRVDIKTDFYVRVVGDKESVSLAAQTLGARTLNPKSVQELMEGKFVSAMRSVISDMTLDNLQSSSLKFTNEVHKLVENVVTKNGLELESVSLSKLDQTSKEFFDPGNTFDAEGLIKITEETEASRKKRNDIQKSTELKIEQTNLENQLQVTFDRPEDDSMITYSWQVEDLTGNLIAPNDPLNPRDLYEGIFNMWSYYDPDPNTNPNANPDYPYVGTWYWHRTSGVKDTDDTVDLSNIDSYLYAEQCCALGVGYKINWKNYIPPTSPIKASRINETKNKIYKYLILNY